MTLNKPGINSEEFWINGPPKPVYVNGKSYFKYNAQLLENPKRSFWNKIFSFLRLTSPKYKYKIKILND